MATILGNPDGELDRIRMVLDAYEAEYPGSQAAVRRTNPASIRIRIIDDRFAGMPKSRRHDRVVDFLQNRLDDDTLQDLTVILPLPAGELRNSLANLDFEEPLATRL